MYSFGQISHFNSDQINISTDFEHTKNVLKRLWINASYHEKIQALVLGSYKDISCFDEIINKGRIDVKTASVLSYVFEIDPYYIIGLSKNDNGYNENLLIDFIENYCGPVIIDESKNMISTYPIAKEISNYLSTYIIDTNELSEHFKLNESRNIIRKLKTEAKSESINAKIKLLLIKKILEY